ncbi:uncharacterized protein DUF4245 [Antricoccus suffuscus]|uniref:Uncharacterized protein DUF4245 n=2 Tax=Antricoccus suffuscus TaxID=1629062 RepID=A0A2T0ZXA9_9ACTN|nr:uncharacterized protein DUF4245 [Antricoccus suffuscus]
MLRSLVPIVVLVVLFAYFCMPKSDNKINTIDPQDNITSMAEYGAFSIVAPKALDKSWKPTSSKLLRDDSNQLSTPTGLTIGYVTPKMKFARFTIRQGVPEAVLKASVDDATVTDDPAGNAVQIAGRSWTPITTDKGRGYVNVAGSGAASIVIVLVGSASYDELKELATALQPVAKKS